MLELNYCKKFVLQIFKRGKIILPIIVFQKFILPTMVLQLLSYMIATFKPLNQENFSSQKNLRKRPFPQSLPDKPHHLYLLCLIHHIQIEPSNINHMSREKKNTNWNKNVLIFIICLKNMTNSKIKLFAMYLLCFNNFGIK